MQIRALNSDDAAEYQTLRLQALRECPSAFASSYEEECDTPIETVAERLAVTPDRCMLGAFNDRRLVGLLGLQREELRKLSHKAYVWGMYVAPEARRQGIGRQLVSQALARAASMTGVRQVYLGVNAANVAAIALYEEIGFQTFAVERDFLLVDGMAHDEMHMVIFLSLA